MIELPEAVTLSRQLVEALQGRSVERVIAGASPHKLVWYFGDVPSYQKTAAGKALVSARAVGGMVEAALDDVRLLFAEGVNLRLIPAGSPLPQRHQLAIRFSDGSVLVAWVQMYGGMGLFGEGENANPYYLAARALPSPLSDAFDRPWFAGLLAPSGVDKLSAKAFLATEQRIPGLGNGVLQDILFEAGVHPKRRMGTLDDEARGRLYRAVKTVLAKMAGAGGRNTELDLYGRPGGYATLMSRNTAGKPCPACRKPIVKATYMGGSVYFCPTCQPN